MQVTLDNSAVFPCVTVRSLSISLSYPHVTRSVYNFNPIHAKVTHLRAIAITLF